MFSNTIVDSDKFLDMPLTSQALYFHLGMKADDDGFVGNPKKITRAVSCTEDDLKLLIAKGFAIAFDSGVIVITHFNIHNKVRKDRKKDTFFQSEKQLLQLDENRVYALNPNAENQMTTICQPTDNQLSAQGKVSKVKLSETISCRETPTIHHSEIAEIVAYLNDKLGTRYKPATANTKKHISARLNEGYTVSDFRTVIDSKVHEWRGTEYEKYLRPDTLFGAKFESYLNTADRSGTQKGGIAQFMNEPTADN
ncbi:conserved phage C-terminal domain-containing protein [Ruminococcus sp.]|uniref:conserved phage C-terminal domain-containing protein n=1 Tax=Ruminococcus sp. TaxID=41978 RepID=UPI00388DBADE